ncbi:MAG: methanogenesis marker 8 protein [Candidatus Methanomethylophilaceae archaeon]|jgi:putative methanogenesis marker protein 8
MTRHVLEAMGKAKVVIEDGRVTEIGQPLIEYCPLFKRHRGIDCLTPETIRENVEFRMRDFGMCSSSRSMRMEDFLSFGVSELLSMGVANGHLDAAVLVCDGAGSCVVDDPSMIQGIGGRISGIISTDTIPEVVQAIGEEKVLDAQKGAIDQFEMTYKAFQLKYRTLGVTVASPKDARMLRDAYGDSVRLFAVHTTGLGMEEAEIMFDNCDVITACASQTLREVAKKRALLQVGTRIPIYAATEFGKMLMLERLRQMGKEPADGEDDPPWPTI